jgi:hypothetical protein
MCAASVFWAAGAILTENNHGVPLGAGLWRGALRGARLGCSKATTFQPCVEIIGYRKNNLAYRIEI